MKGYTSKKAVPTCPHNDAVICNYKEKPCALCGWNPLVAKARIEKITKKHTTSKIPKK